MTTVDRSAAPTVPTRSADGRAPSADAEDLRRHGYRPQLERSLGLFSSFAAAFSLMSVLTSLFQLFAFGFLNAGPPVWWTWLIVFAGQLLVALCFAELAGQYPLAGSIYQWSKQISSSFVSWMTGWTMIVGTIVTIAAVAVGWQVILPQISTAFQFVGGARNAGLYSTPDGARNALILGVIVVLFTTVVNVAGVKWMARINNLGVIAEMIGSVLLIILLATHVHRGPEVVVHSLGTGAGHSWGYAGALLVGLLMPAYCMYGFDCGSTLAEETRDPRRAVPPAILRALVTVFFLAALVTLLALMAAGNIHDKQLGLLGLPYIVKQQLGDTLGNIFLVDVVVAVTVCALANHTSAIRMLFAMARDGRLPFGRQIARVSSKRRVPVVPAVTIGLLTIALLALNIANQSVFLTLSGVAVVLIYLAYLGVTGPLLLARLRGAWPRRDHGRFFSLGRGGVIINAMAVVYGAFGAIDMAWPRAAVYGDAHWYFQYGAFIFIGATILGGSVYYRTRLSRRPLAVLAEHRAATPELGSGDAAVSG